MSDRRDDIEGEGVVAAEYALGLLEGAEYATARTREASDNAFAHEVARWRGYLAPLHDGIDDVAPPASHWDRVQTAIRRVSPANDNDLRLRRSLNFWRSTTAGMTAVAAVLGFLLVMKPRPAPIPPTVAAVQAPVPAEQTPPMVAIASGRTAATVVISWDPNTRELVLGTAGTLAADPKHSHQLWVIPAGGRPRSLGVLPAGKTTHQQLASALADLLQQGATIAISLEPRGGSPTGAPTGPVVASGALSPA
ncbi:anti-sigma factor [Sphingomonas sp.]|uniref:anti-sigma factor n=1 Tax=Sphingomonas sp. TaxID=28214 RepID=UPI0025ECA406|nr:anti-sigma factor [Sphingomonas sp.]MBV9529219.1 anti-sigma factor [Sphingomonas sp.]